MITSIRNNPFRILGVFTNASLKVITANKGKIAAFAKVGKAMVLPMDISSFLPAPNRSIEDINSALSVINLPKDKIRHALFWFINTSSIDEIAINHIQNENYEKAFDIFGKKKCYSSLLNSGVLAFLQEDLETAIENITELIHEDEYRESFVETICGSSFVISEEDLVKLFIDELLYDISASELLQLFKSSGKSGDDDDYIRNIVVRELISLINREIEKAKKCENSAEEEYKAGVKLINSTKTALKQLRDNLSSTDLQYQTTVDALARQILQCGINYFNVSEDIDKALVVQRYALSIAVSKLLRDRCKENIDILEQRKKLEGASEYIKLVTNELKSFKSRYTSIETAMGLMKRCKPHLEIIENKLGSSDELFLAISSAVVHNTLEMLIDVINKEQENEINVINGTLKSNMDRALQILNEIKTLKMDAQCRTRLNQNEQTLKGLQSQLIQLNNAMQRPNSSRTASNYQTQASSSNSEKTFFEENTGCVIWFIIGLVVAVIIIASLS